MKRSFSVVCAWVFCLIGFSAVQAGEQRVLLSFDGSGHQVRQIVHTDSTPAKVPGLETSTSYAVVPDLQALRREMKAGSATLLWLDDAGSQMALVYEPDPRLSHAPSHIDGTSESRFGEQAGAWLVTGPAGATQLLLLLAEDQSLGLGFESWNLSLAGY